ncbi:MAG TPA: penicillin-binding protein 2 [Gaiellaceae bacterium]|nr:penicillin-binding protein 2 [Gaiellaceae bacterium]
MRRANRRIRLVVAVFALVFAVALVRVAWLQAVRADALDRLATSQHRETLEVPAHRGTIFDRLGVQLAIGERATTVYANPRQIVDPRRAAVAAGRALGVEAEKLYPLLADRSRGFVYVARKADPERAEALRRQDIVGFGFYPEERRAYPQRAIASEVVGYAGVDNRGLSGIELEYDAVLAGEGGSKTIVRDPFGRTLQVIESDPVRDGRDVHLTIDHTIQGHVERVLRETRSTWSAEAATAVVMDVETGGILALGVEPGFDANEFPVVARRDLARLRNRAVTDTYEPGSTFKVTTIAGVLESGLVAPRTRFTLPYSIQVADRVIHDAVERGTQTMTVAQILSQSSNVGVVTLAIELQRQALSEWIRRFGFGRPTGIDYPGESKGIVLPPDDWSGSTIGNVPIGQGIAVTPMQMVAAYGALANEGVWLQPHLVERVEGEEAVEPKRRRVISERVAKQLKRMLRGVVEEGSGTSAQVPGYHIAGKTGTAAKPEPTGGYSTSRYVASFVGYVPASKPRIVVLVMVDEPKGTIWGGVVAAPAFAEIAQFALQYLEVPPDAPRAAGSD